MLAGFSYIRVADTGNLLRLWSGVINKPGTCQYLTGMKIVRVDESSPIASIGRHCTSDNVMNECQELYISVKQKGQVVYIKPR